MKLFSRSIGLKTLLELIIFTVVLYLVFRSLLSPLHKSNQLRTSTNFDKVCKFLVSTQKLSHDSKKYRQLNRVCKANTKYTITSLQHLWDNVEHLHCIFHLGVEPQRVPQGPLYGELFVTFGTYLLNPIFKAVWRGKLITKVNCKEKKDVYLGWNYVGGPMAPFVASVEPLATKIHTSSFYSDNKTALFFDLTVDVKESCSEMNETDAEKYPIKDFSPWGRKFWPLTQVVDGLRPVGKQEDGGIIYLGQTYILDIYRTDKMAIPVGFFAVVNYDAEAVPFLKHGDSLPPFRTDVHYRREGFIRSLIPFFPFNILREPLHTLAVVFNESWLFVKNGLPFLKDYIKAPFSGTKEELGNHLKPPKTLKIPRSKFYGNSNFISVHEPIHRHQLEL